MGHRANYAIRKDGEVTLYYSHWGALTVPEDFFWGPGYAVEFVRSHRQCDPESEWLDDVWGEGGAALDLDKSVVTLFGGEALGHPPLRDTFAALMAALWAAEGWTVEWAESGMPAIAAAVGCDPALATSEPIPPFPIDLESAGSSFETGDPVAGCLVTVVRGGEHEHRIVDSGIVNTLYSGPGLVDAFDRLPTVAKAVEVWDPPDYRDPFWTLGDELSHSGIINFDTRTVAFRDDFAERSTRQFLAQKWQGWRIEQFDGPIDSHFERLGVLIPLELMPQVPDVSDPSEVELTEEAALADVAKHLLKTERKDPAAFVRELRDSARDDDRSVVVNPDAETSPATVDLDVETRQQLFGKAIARMQNGAD